MRTEVTVEIDRPIEEVFEFAIDHVAEWSTIVVEDKVIDQTPEGVGTTFLCVTEDRGKRMDFDGLVTEHDPPTLSVSKLTGKHFDIDIEYRFEDLGRRTRLTQISDVTGKGMTKVMFILFGWLMKKSGCNAAENELLNLKQLLESRE